MALTFTDLSKADALALAAVAAVATVGHVVGDGATGRRTATLGLYLELYLVARHRRQCRRLGAALSGSVA